MAPKKPKRGSTDMGQQNSFILGQALVAHAVPTENRCRARTRTHTLWPVESIMKSVALT